MLRELFARLAAVPLCGWFAAPPALSESERPGAASEAPHPLARVATVTPPRPRVESEVRWTHLSAVR